MKEPPLSRLRRLVRVGRVREEDDGFEEACACWLAAWHIVMRTTTPAVRSTPEFMARHGLTDFDFDWFHDLLEGLLYAGFSDPTTAEKRVHLCRTFLEAFPDESPDHALYLRLTLACALWDLGRFAQAEDAFAETVRLYPEEPDAYLEWSDHYGFLQVDEERFNKADEILRQARAQPALRRDPRILLRQAELYGRCERWDRAFRVLEELQAAIQRPARA